MLEAMGLVRRAGGEHLLDHVSLVLNAGDRIALLGPTGSGKSVLLRALALLDPLDAGEVRWQGYSISPMEVPGFRSRVAYLHQRPAMLEGSVEEILQQPFALRVHQDKQYDRARILEQLTMLERDETFLSKQQRDLSGGEEQVTALLRVLQLEPAVLLLDEPTAALDATSTNLVETLVTGWLDECPSERAALWVTHDRAQAERFAHTVLHIDAGRLAPA